MKCPECGRPSTVRDTYRMASGATRRYRACSAGHRFKTIEVLDQKSYDYGSGIRQVLKLTEEVDE